MNNSDIETTPKNISGKKLAVLILVILAVVSSLGFAVTFTVAGIMKSNEPVEPPQEHGAFHINPQPAFFYLIAGIFAAHALIVLTFGIFAYLGKKWAAIALIVFGLSGYFGAIAGIVVLVNPRKKVNNYN